MNPQAASVDSGPVFVMATEQFLACADTLGQGELYRNDLIELVVQAAGGYVDEQLALATQSIAGRELATAKTHAQEALATLGEMDSILNFRPDRRLETWVEAARAQAGAADEAAYYDENGRLLITTWGWPGLSDYASRAWSGLTRDYYAARWQAWFAAQWSGAEFSLDLWQQSWLSRPYTPSAPKPVDNLFTAAKRMLARCRCDRSSQESA